MSSCLDAQAKIMISSRTLATSWSRPLGSTWTGRRSKTPTQGRIPQPWLSVSSVAQKAETRELLNSRQQSENKSQRKLLLRDGINSGILLLDQFRGWEIVWLVIVIVLPGHHRFFGNLPEVIIKKRQSRIVNIIQIIRMLLY